MEDRFLAMQQRNGRNMLTLAIAMMFVIGPLAWFFAPLGIVVGPVVSGFGLLALVSAIRARRRVASLG